MFALSKSISRVSNLFAGQVRSQFCATRTMMSPHFTDIDLLEMDALRRKDVIMMLLSQTAKVDKAFSKQLPASSANQIREYFQALTISECPAYRLSPLLEDMANVPLGTLQRNQVRVSRDFNSLVFLINKADGVAVEKVSRSLNYFQLKPPQ